MNTAKTLWALAVLNVALVGALAWKLTGNSPAHAQRALMHGDYVMVPASVSGANAGVVYMVDTRNAMLGGFIYDPNRHDVSAMPPVNLARIFEGGGPAVPARPRP